MNFKKLIKKNEEVLIYYINNEKIGFNEEYQLNSKKDKKFRAQVEQFANYLLNEHLPYDDLCWELAEFQLIYEKGKKKYSEKQIRKKVEMLYEISPSYRELCWIIAMYKVFLAEIKIYP